MDVSEKSNTKLKIKFDVNISQNSVNVLDVKVILDNGTLKTTLFTKSTDSLIFKLQFSSSIPCHLKYSQSTVHQNSMNMSRKI